MADDFSKLINKKSIFSNLRTVDFFRNDEAGGFTKKMKETQYTSIVENRTSISRPVNYFSGRHGIWGGESEPKGFTLGFKNKDNTLFIKNITNKYDSYKNLVIEPFSWDMSWQDKNFRLETQKQYGDKTSPIENLKTSFLKYDGTTTSNINVSSYGKTELNRTFNYKDLTTVTFGNGTQNSYSRLLSIKSGTTLSEYYQLSSLSIKNNVSQLTSYISEPYITSKIGTRYGSDNNQSSINIIDQSLSPFRAGVTTMVDVSAEDVKRIGNFLLSPRGLMFITKQVGLQAMSPRPETNPNSLIFAGTYPVRLLESVAGHGFGIRIPRHGGDTYYKENDSAFFDILSLSVIGPDYNQNRLEYFQRELLIENPGSEFIPTSRFGNPGVSVNQHSIYGIRALFGWPSDLGYKRATNTIFGRTELPTGIKGTVDYTSRSHKNFKNLFEAREKKYSDVIVTGDRSNELNIYGEVNGPNIDKRIENFDINTKIYSDKQLNNIYAKTKLNNQIIDTQKYQNDSTYAKRFPHSHVTESIISRNNNYQTQLPDWEDPVKPYFTGSDGADGEYDIAYIVFEPVDSTSNTYTIKFRAIVDSISDAWSPTYTDIKYIGNPIVYPIYQSVKRALVISFKVPIYSNKELIKVTDNLRNLQKLCLPAFIQSSEGRIVTPFIKFKLGATSKEYYKDLLSVITSLTYTIDSTTPWLPETNDEFDITPFYPSVINATVNLDVLPSPLNSAYKVTNSVKKEQEQSVEEQTKSKDIVYEEYSTNVNVGFDKSATAPKFNSTQRDNTLTKPGITK